MLLGQRGLTTWLTWLVALLLAGVGFAQEKRGRLDAERGRPFLRHFTPRQIGGGPQLIVGLRALDGVLYFAANRSVLEFDGSRWRRVGVPTPRQLILGGDGRVWVGCDGDFGYLETGGEDLEFVSQRYTLPVAERPSQRIRGVGRIGDTIHFLYTDGLVRVTPSGNRFRTEISRPGGGSFEAMAVVGDEVWVFQHGAGLHRWGETATVVSGPESVSSVLPFGEERFLLAADRGRILAWERGEVRPFSPPAEELLGGAQIWRLTRLGEDRIAVASRGRGMLWLDASGEVPDHWNRRWGLPSDEVFDVVQDAQGSLWIATGDGLAQVLESLPLGFYRAAEDPRAMVSQIRHQERLYLGGGDGGYRLRPAEGLEPARFERVDGLQGVIGSWAETPLGLLAASSHGSLYQVEGLRAEEIGPGRTLAWSADDGLALATDDPHLRILWPEASGWKAIEHRDVLPDRIAEIVPAGAGVYWLVSQGSLDLYCMTFPSGFAAPPRFEQFLLESPWPRPLWLDGQLLFRVGPDVFVAESKGPDASLRPDPRFRILDWIEPGEDRYGLKVLPSGRLWLFSRDRARPLELGPDGRYRPSEPALGLPVRLNFDVLPDGRDEIFWLATDGGPVRFETELTEPPGSKPRIRFLPPADRLRESSDAPVLAHGTGALRFEVAVPFFLEPSLNRYRFRLVGLDERWSEWTDEPVKEFTNLPGRRFRFEVQARHGDRLLETSHFAFRVLPPWYQTWWARLLAVLALATGLFVYVRVERRKTEKEREINHQLRQFDRLKDEFLANTSHELRTPLFGITGLAEALLAGSSGKLTEEARGTLEMIVSSGHRLSHLVNDILDFSKLRHNSLALHKHPVDLWALTEVVLALSRPLVETERLHLINRVPRDLPPAEADEKRLQQILHNLVGNAVKFTEKGTVEVSAAVDSGELVVRVRDTGIGIPAGEQARIFEAFEQAESTLEHRVGGTGLGLAVTRQLVELHGGAIEVESWPGEGSTFSFNLPIASGPPVNLVEPPVFTDGAEPGSVTVASPVPRAVEGRMARILIVDDEPVNLRVLSGFLAGEPYELTLVSSGSEALEILETQAFDLVLLDVMMPRISGYEVCQALRRSQKRADLPVIFLTAKGLSEDVITGLALGANDYLTKPISKSELLARVEPHLELVRMHRELEDLVEQKVAQIKVLGGLLPICGFCKKVRDDKGYWSELESFLASHSEAEVTHGLCPDCLHEQYPDVVSQRPN